MLVRSPPDNVPNPAATGGRGGDREATALLEASIRARAGIRVIWSTQVNFVSVVKADKPNEADRLEPKGKWPVRG